MGAPRITPRFLAVTAAVVIGAVLPFAFDNRLLDYDSAPRFFILSLWCALFLIFCWRRLNTNNANIVSKTSFELVFVCYVLWRAAQATRAFDVADALYECCKSVALLMAYGCFVALINTVPHARMYLSRGVCFAVVVFTAFGLADVAPSLFAAITTNQTFVARGWFGSLLFNKNFFAETLVVGLPFIFSTLLFDSKFWWRRSASVLVVTSIFMLVVLQCVSAWLGVVIGVCIVAGLLFKEASTALKRSTWRMVGIAVITVLIGGLWLTRHGLLQELRAKTQTTWQTLTNPGTTVYNSFTERLLVWQHTWRMIKAHPWLGVGTGNWKILIPSYGLYDVGFMNGGTLRFEHPHNEFLLATAEGGILELLLLASLFVLSITALSRRVKRVTSRHEKLTDSLLIGGIAAFAVMACFGYPLERFYSAVLLMLLFAFASHSAVSSVEQTPIVSSKRNPLPLVAATACVALCWVFAMRYMSERRLAYATDAEQHRDWRAMYVSAVASKSFVLKSDLLATPVDWYAGVAKFYGSGGAASAEPLFEAATRINPYHLQAWNDLGTCREQRRDYSDAVWCYKQALKINPVFTNTLLNLTAAYYNEGFVDSAYATVVRLPRYYTSEPYRTYLVAVLRAKLKTDSIAGTSNLHPTVVKEKILLDAYDGAQRQGKKFEDIYSSMSK